MPLTFGTWLLAFLPVLVVLILMLGLRWGGSKAGAVSWFAAVVIAVVFFGAGFNLLAYSQVKAILLSLDVLYIIWTALLLFHIADEAGAVRMIGQALPRLTGDRTMQGLLLGWLFASFLQGMGGFGVPVAVAAPLLVGLGFSPVKAVIMACIGHGWAVNFGSLATSFQTLMAVTGLPGELLAPESSLLLGISSFACGGVVAFVAGGWRGLRHTLPAVFLLSAVMGITQHLLVTNGLWTLGATGGAMAGLVVGVLLTRLPVYRHARAEDGLEGQTPTKLLGFKQLALAFSAYIVLVVLAFALNLIQPINTALNSVSFNLHFPQLETALGWVTPAEAGRKIVLFGHPGAMLLYASIIAYLIYARAGYLKPGALGRILGKVGRGAVNSSLGIIAAYPVISPFIGALGAFLTGSNNNSNVLFAGLQMRTAQLLGLSVSLTLASQTAGGSLGSVMAPAKVIVGCSTVGLGDNEGVVMGKILLYGLIPVALVAVVVVLLVVL
jgi:lactate permease